MTFDKPQNYSKHERFCDLEDIRNILDFRTNMIKVDINSIADTAFATCLLKAIEIFEDNYSLNSRDNFEQLKSLYDGIESSGTYEKNLIENINRLKALGNNKANKKLIENTIRNDVDNIIFLQRWMLDGVKFIHILRDIVDQRLQEEYALFSFQEHGNSFFSVDKVYNVLDTLSISYFDRFTNYQPKVALSVLGEESLKIWSYGSPSEMVIVTQMPFHFIYRTRYWGLLAHEAANVFFRHWDSFESDSPTGRKYIRKKPEMEAKLEILDIINKIKREQGKMHKEIAFEIIDSIISLATILPPSLYYRILAHIGLKNPRIDRLKKIFVEVQPKWETTLREIAADIIAVRIAGLSYAIPFLTLNAIQLSGRKEIYRLLKHQEIDNLKWTRNISCARSYIIVNELLCQKVEYPDEFACILESLSEMVDADLNSIYEIADYFDARDDLKKFQDRIVHGAFRLSADMENFLKKQIISITSDDYNKSVEIFDLLNSKKYGEIIEKMNPRSGGEFTPTHILNAAWLKRYKKLNINDEFDDHEWWGRIIWVLSKSSKVGDSCV